MNKNKIGEKLDRESVSITKIFRENYAWFIAVVTSLGVVALNILRFIEYISARAYFSYYGLDINLYKYYDQSFLYELCISLIFLYAVGSLMYCFKQLNFNFKNKKIKKSENLYNIMIILSSNFYLVLVTKGELSLLWMLIYFASFLVIEIAISYFAFRTNKHNSTESVTFKDTIKNFIKYLPFVIILFIGSYFLKTYFGVMLKNEYRIIDENKAIVYSNNDYYLILDCEIDDDNLVIYRGTQTKINNINIQSKLKKFKSVKVK